MSTSSAESAPRTLAEQLRSWSDARVGHLLEQRPDLGVPTPQDSTQLAARAASRPSVARALDALSVLELGVAEAVLHLAPCTLADISSRVDASADSVAAAVDRLSDLVVLWGTPEQLHAVSVLGEAMGSPRGPEIAAVPGLLDALSGAARALLTHLDERDADGRTESVTEPVRELLDRRLLVLRDDRRTTTVPWSVRVALRDGRSTRTPLDDVPALATSERAADLVDRAAAGAAFEAVRRTELLLDLWGTQAPGVLRAGGLAVRDLKAAAVLLDVTPHEAGLVVETAHAAGLIGPGSTDEVDAGWLPTEAFDAWLALPVAERWTGLARAWLANPRLTGLVGGRDEADRPVNALAPDLERSWLVAARRDTLLELVAMTGVLATGTGLPSLIELLRWRRPRGPLGRVRAVGWTLGEAGFLGLVGVGGLASYARSLLEGDDPVPLLAPLLPEPVDHVLIQADLTAVAPGPLAQELARELGVVADVESRGGATVYRFGTQSVRRAFDAGWSALEIKDFLTRSSRTPVPQALDFLVDDVARRFGTLRVGAVEAFLRSDDEAAMAALVADPTAASLRLRLIAPTVVVSDVPLQVLLPRLREIGHAPVVEAADGTVRLVRPDVFRSRVRPPRRLAARDQARQAARTSAQVAAIRSGDRVAATRPTGLVATSPGDVLSLLRQAADAGREVLVDYVDNHGRRTERLVTPLRVEGGQLVAYDEREDDQRTYAVPRISSARVI